MQGLAASNVLPLPWPPLPRSPSPLQQRTWSWPSPVARDANNTSLWDLEQGQPQLMCLCLGAVESCAGAQASPDGKEQEMHLTRDREGSRPTCVIVVCEKQLQHLR